MSSRFSRTPISEGAALVSTHAKLRGSAARELEGLLQDLAFEGVARVVLDCRTQGSIDAVGTYAIEKGLDSGLRLHLVVSPAFDFDTFFRAKSLTRRGLRVHTDGNLDGAVRQVRDIVESGLALV